MKYPKRLSSGANNTVIVLSETEVAKLFTDDTRSDIGSEAEKMKFANSINDLVVKFIRLDFNAEFNAELLIMERIKPIDYRAFEVEKRELWVDVFEDELKELHKAGFVHRDLRRPSNIGGLTFDNILLTEHGIRLIDVGISAMRTQVGDVIFEKFIEQELEELNIFKEYFISLKQNNSLFYSTALSLIVTLIISPACLPILALISFLIPIIWQGVFIRTRLPS